MYVGFEYCNGEWVERMPSLFGYLKQYQRRALFLTQYNWCTDPSEKVLVKSCRRPLVEIFYKAITDMIPKPLSPHAKAKNFSPVSAVLIHLFLHKKPKDVQRHASSLTYVPQSLMAKRIYRLFAKEIPGMVFDGRQLFLHFVYEKIAKRNQDKDVYIRGDEILIECDGERLLSVVPCLKQIHKDNPKGAQNEISRAWSRLADNGTQAIYLVFPRNQNFTRHIEVRHSHEEKARVKLVPYIISHLAKECR